MTSWITQRTSLKKVILLFLAASIIYGIMILITIPYLKSNIGLDIFDMRPFGYSIEEARNILSSIDNETAIYYKYVQIPIDFVYPLMMALYASFLLGIINRYYKFPEFIILLPFVACVFDYLENIAIIVMLSGSPSDIGIIISSGFTIIKSMTTIIFMTLIIVYGSVVIINKVKGNYE